MSETKAPVAPPVTAPAKEPTELEKQQAALKAKNELDKRKQEAYNHAAAEIKKAEEYVGKRKFNPFFFISPLRDKLKVIENRSKLVPAPVIEQTIKEVLETKFNVDDITVQYDEPQGTTRQINSTTQTVVKPVQ